MRFVKTLDEIRRIQGIYAKCQFLGTKNLMVTFETTPEAISALLPPPLEPTPEPLGSAWIGDVSHSNAVGPFTGAALYVRARYHDIVGHYCVTMPMSTPEAVTFGRELYGEPAKLATTVFEQQDEHVWGYVERHQIRYMSLRGRMSEPAETSRQQMGSFFFKYSHRVDGMGFDAPPLLVLLTRDTNVTVAKRGRGELVFRDSIHDPLSDIPIRQVIDAVYTEGHIYTSGRVLCEVDPDQFLPYAFTRIDSMEAVAESGQLRVSAARKTAAGKGQWRGS